jgi:integrase/recombinase XerC
MTAEEASTAAARHAELAAARLLLSRMGVSPADLLAAPEDSPAMPRFAEYIAQVRASVGPGTRRVYGSYWNRILDRWPERRLDEISASDIRHLVEHTKNHTVVRRNARGGRSAGEHLIAALRCLYHTPRTTS